FPSHRLAFYYDDRRRAQGDQNRGEPGRSHAHGSRRVCRAQPQSLVQKGAGIGSGLPDRAYENAGATMVGAEEIWRDADLIMKVKEPQVSEYPLLRPGLILFTYLHLAASESVTRALLEHKVTSIGYETIQLDDGSLPLLAPMSEIAGRLSLQVGA